MKAFIVISTLALAINVLAVEEADITQCKKDRDCMIVPYRHAVAQLKKRLIKSF